MVKRIQAKKPRQPKKRDRKPKKGEKKRRRGIAKVMQALAQDRISNGGQPTTYHRDFARQAGLYAKNGATDFDIAELLGVTVPTVRKWMVEHQEFFVAIHENKEGYDQRVERAMAQRAVGYDYHSEKIVVVEGEVIRVPIVEHVPPSEKAGAFWLTNRKSNDWKERRMNEFDPNQPMKVIVEGGLPRPE